MLCTSSADPLWCTIGDTHTDVLDDFSRYIIAWTLCTNRRAANVTDTLDLALKASGCDSATVLHKPRLLSENGPSYIAGELAQYIEAYKMSHVRGAPMHLQIQGKIESWHQTLKNRILQENYFSPCDLETEIEAFIEHCMAALSGNTPN